MGNKIITYENVAKVINGELGCIDDCNSSDCDLCIQKNRILNKLKEIAENR